MNLLKGLKHWLRPDPHDLLPPLTPLPPVPPRLPVAEMEDLAKAARREETAREVDEIIVKRVASFNEEMDYRLRELEARLRTMQRRGRLSGG